VICKVEEMTATRVRARRICMRASDWAEEARVAREVGQAWQDAGSRAPRKDN
jgi:hypothetical protein